MTGREGPNVPDWASKVAPRGSVQRRVARVGRQVLRDRGRYLGDLRTAWAASADALDGAGADAAYASWLDAHRASSEELADQRRRGAAIAVTIDWFVEDGPEPARSASRASLAAQTHPHHRALPSLPTGSNVAEAPESAAAGEAVTGPDVVVVLAAGDVLEPDALFAIAATFWDDPTLEAVTWDADGPGADGVRRPRFGPAWSPDALWSENPYGHCVAVRTDTLRAVGGLPTGRGDDRWWGLLLRIAEHTDRVAHIPRVLAHLATVPGSPSTTVDAHAALAVVGTHLDRTGARAEVEWVPDRAGGAVRTRWALDPAIRARIVVPTRHNRPRLSAFLDGLAATTAIPFAVTIVDNGPRTEANEAWYESQRAALGLDLDVHWWDTPFNYSAVNNAGAAGTSEDLLVFCNDDTVALDPGWLAELAGWACRPGVGLVGAHLLDEDGLLQHGGVVVGLGGFADHLFQGLAPDADSLFGPVRRVRNASAVTAACVAIRREVFDELGGFDERFVLCGSDVALGLAAVEAGYRNVCTPFAGVRHAESATRGDAPIPESDFFTSWWPYERWLRGGDPWFSPSLSRWSREPALAGPDEPSPLALVGEIVHRPLASGGAWDPDEHARWLLRRSDLGDDVVAAVAARHAAATGHHPPRTVTWWLPDLTNPFYGGIHTVLRMADWLARVHDVASSFVVCADPNEPWYRSAYAAAYSSLADAPIVFADDPSDVDRAPATDLAVATLWETAYLAARSTRARRTAYLVQDIESTFHAAGAVRALAEGSYGLGLDLVCNTTHVLDQVRLRTDAPAVAFEPAVDPRIFHAEGRSSAAGTAAEPATVFAYARGTDDRSSWGLVRAALAEVKRRRGAAVRIVTAGSFATEADRGAGITPLGFLPYPHTGDLYRAVDVGVCVQQSEHPSYLPLELLACGAAVVATDHRAADWLLRDGENARRTRPTPTALADAITELVDDPGLRARLGTAGASEIAAERADWDAAFAPVWEFLCDPDRHR